MFDSIEKIRSHENKLHRQFGKFTINGKQIPQFGRFYSVSFRASKLISNYTL